MYIDVYVYKSRDERSHNSSFSTSCHAQQLKKFIKHKNRHTHCLRIL